MIRISTPTPSDRAVAASSLKANRNGAAMNRMAAAYSTIPWTNAGTGPCLNTAWTPLPAEHGRGLVQARVEQLGLRQRLVERDELDLGPAQRDHLPEVALVRGVDRRHPEARPEHAVVGQRGAAALHVAEYRHARLEAGALLDLALELHRDPSEPHVAERVRPAAELRLDLAVLRRRALGDDDDRERVAALVAMADPLAHLLDVERPLGHQDHVGPARHPGVAGDPAGRAPHHLDDDHAVVRLGRRVQSVDRVRRDLHGGVEAERHVGAGEGVVDRLRPADHRDAVGGLAPGCAERVLAADRDERVHALRLERRAHHGRPVGVAPVRVRPRRAEDRAAAVEDARGVLGGELDRVALEHAGPPVAEADDLVAVAVAAGADDAADDRVQPGAVAAAGEHSDAHARHPAMRAPTLKGRAQIRHTGRYVMRTAPSHGRRATPSGTASPSRARSVAISMRPRTAGTTTGA